MSTLCYTKQRFEIQQFFSFNSKRETKNNKITISTAECDTYSIEILVLPIIN